VIDGLNQPLSCRPFFLRNFLDISISLGQIVSVFQFVLDLVLDRLTEVGNDSLKMLSFGLVQLSLPGR
jgi:hypothetical protein